MTGWLNQDFSFGNEVIPSLSSTSALSSQGQNLAQIIQSAGGNQYVLIGHSQGGLISRYTAQYLQGQNVPAVRGVITMNTPNQGAALTQTGPYAIGLGVQSLANELFGDFGCTGVFDNVGCILSDYLYLGAAALAQTATNTVNSLQDLNPGSQFLTQLNGKTETFQRASITGQTPQRWLVARIADDFVNTGVNPDDATGERNIAATMEYIFDAITLELGAAASAQIGQIIFCSDQDGFANGDPFCTIDFTSVILQDVQILTTMDKVDHFYNRLIAPDGHGSDGFVQKTSQPYPSASATQYTVANADSHLASTRSPYDHTALDVLLRNVYQVPAPAACQYATNPSSITVPAGGGTYTFNLNTASGCQWSATSQSPWISLAANSTSGQSAATVTFYVQPLATNVPRSGTIQIGSGTGTYTTTTVNEGAGCSYSLSTSSIAFSTSGGSYTVFVTAQTGCPWSATTNASSWISLQNASGTGSGSFVVNASGSRGGQVSPYGAPPFQVDVMDQAVTVTEDPPVHCGLCR